MLSWLYVPIGGSIKNESNAGRCLEIYVSGSRTSACAIFTYLFCEVYRLIAALYADGVKFSQQILDPYRLFFLTGQVQDGFALMHHQKAVAILCSVS